VDVRLLAVTQEFQALEGERLGSLLFRRRRELGLTRTDLAVAVGISSDRTIVRWEKEGVRPKRGRDGGNLRILSDVLSIPMAILLAAHTLSTNARFIKIAECGTVGGHQKHKRLGEPICADCMEAARVYERVRTGSPRELLRQPARCGTQRGLSRHYRLGESPCDACLESNRLYRNPPISSPPSPSLQCGTASGSAAHRRRGEKACPECREAYLEDLRKRYLRRTEGRKRVGPVKHGTTAGYRKHARQRDGEWGIPACENCRTAVRDYTRQIRA
jgi:transcriptional regulator with XRE-family HTH domain